MGGAIMEGGLRKRSTPTRSNSATCSHISATPLAVETQKNPFLVGFLSWGQRVWIIFHVVGTLFYVHGWISRISLHNGSECEMTYSFPHFLPVETYFSASSKLSQPYKLYKFVDGRDPRYQSLLKKGTALQQQQQPLTGSSHCGAGSSNTTLVLYIPGHWGSYHQARSLGAHGTQWTRARENPQRGQHALATGTWSGKADQLQNFVYEVYSLDFAEQGGALHASFLEQQCDFLAHTITFLTETCRVDQILLVAHSMGGYVARLLPQRHPHLQQVAPSILTLATPHHNPLYAMDESIHNLHQSLKDTWIISISGGIRDEMIDPFACRLNKGYTYSSTTLVKSGVLGMDHRAIVWCHGLLDQVRKILWIQSQELTPQDQQHRILEMLGPVDYDHALTEMKSHLSSQYGKWTTLAIESAMLYYLPILYGMYALVAGLHCAVPKYYFLASLGILPILPWSDTPISILVILFVVASLIHFLLTFLLQAISFKLGNVSMRFLWSASLVLMGILFPLLLIALRLWNESWTMSGLASCMVYVWGIVAMILSCLWMVGQSTLKTNSSSLYLAGLLVMTAPGILAGRFTLMIWERHVDGSSWWLWARLVIPVLAMAVCQKHTTPRTTPSSSTTAATNVGARSHTLMSWGRGFLILLVILATTGPCVLVHGNSFRVANLVMAMVMTECFLQVLVTFSTREKYRP